MNSTRVVSLLLVPLWGCNHVVVSEGDVVDSVSPNVATIVEVSWTTTEEVSSFVEFGVDESYGMATLADTAALEHVAYLAGLPSESLIHYRIVSMVEGERVEGEDHVTENGNVPDGIPKFDVLAPGDLGGGFIAGSYVNVTAPFSGAFVLNSDGEAVWYHEVNEASCPFVDLSTDGTSLLLRSDSRDLELPSKVVRASLDGRSSQDYETPDGHHAVAQVPDLEFAYIGAVLGEFEGEPVVGDQIVEYRLDGSTEVVWDAFEELEVERHDGWHFADPDVGDWTHANGLAYDEAEDVYYLSLYWLGTLFKIDRASGDILWTLGGSGNEFEFSTVGFGHVHSPEPRPGGMLLFDNGAEGGSEAREFAIDAEALTATDVWAYPHPMGRIANVLGDVDRLDDGSTLIGWGDVGEISVVSEGGEILWSAATEPGVVVGQVSPVPTFYP